MTRFTDERLDFQREQNSELEAMLERAKEMGFVYTEMGGGVTALHNYKTGDNIIARDYDGVPEDINDAALYCHGETVVEFPSIVGALEHIIGNRLD